MSHYTATFCVVKIAFCSFLQFLILEAVQFSKRTDRHTETGVGRNNVASWTMYRDESNDHQ